MNVSLAEPLREWAGRRAEEMGLPGPDSYVELLVRLEKQRLDLKAFEHSPDRPKADR